MKNNKLINGLITTITMAALLSIGFSQAAFSTEEEENSNAAGIVVSIEAPGITTSQIPETNDYYVVDFNSQSNGTDGFVKSHNNTTYTYSSDLEIKNANQWGGSEGSKFITQERLESIRSYKIEVNEDQKYFGFWWSAGDPHNKITFKKDGVNVAEFKTRDLVNFINSSDVTNTANYYGNPSWSESGGHENEPFSFVNIFFKQGSYDEIIVATLTEGGAAFESDNHTFSAEDLDIQGEVLPDATTSAAVNDVIATDEDTSIETNIIENDINPNSDLSISSIVMNGTEYDVGEEIALDSGALLTVESTGQTIYDPNDQFNNLAPEDFIEDSFTYNVVDGKGKTDSAIVALKITGLADAPVSTDDEKSTDEDSAISVPVLKNDSDPDTAKEDLKITSINGTPLNVNQVFELPSGGTVQIKNVGENNRSEKGKHKIKYDPRLSPELQALNDGENFLEVIEYIVEDPEGKAATGILEITVTGITDTYAD
ncbi:MAG: Ig-like domain-containing protein [Cyanobacteria bacterium J06600_6]